MGIVIRQSFWSSIAAYIGVGIGYLNVVILMPKYLSPDEIGLYRTILSTAALFAPIPLFGLKSAFIRFFPRNTDKQNGTLVFIGFLTFGALSIILIGVSLLLEPWLKGYFMDKAAVINDYLWLILVLIFFTGLYNFLESILKAKKNISTPSFVRETLYKGFQALAVIAVGFAWINMHEFLVFQSYIYLLIIVIILFFVIRKFKFSFSASKSDMKDANSSDFFLYARYALLSGLGTVAVLQIDQIMISKYIGLEANAIYTTAMFMAVVIEMPRRYIAQITQPIMAEDFKANRLEKINKDYKKASINQLIMGAYIFLGIAINLPNIYGLMPNGELYSTGISIVYIIGFAKLTNMVFSTNGEIIVMSDHYRINILLIALLGTMTVCLNLLLIPNYGIEGAAYASLLTFFLFNLIKFFYVKSKFNFSPFSKWTLPTVILIPTLLFLNSLFSYSEFILVDILVRSVILSLVFFLFVYLFKPSQELTNILKLIRSKVGLKK